MRGYRKVATKVRVKVVWKADWNVPWLAGEKGAVQCRRLSSVLIRAAIGSVKTLLPAERVERKQRLDLCFTRTKVKSLCPHLYQLCIISLKWCQLLEAGKNEHSHFGLFLVWTKDCATANPLFLQSSLDFNMFFQVPLIYLLIYFFLM